MGLFDRIEGTLDRTIKTGFARVFRAEVQPVEITSAIRRAMDDRAAIVSRGRVIVPNVFTIELSDDDFDRLTSYDETVTDELVADAQEYVAIKRYTPGGPLQIELVADPELETGVFRLHHETVRNPATLDERGQIDAWGEEHGRYTEAELTGAQPVDDLPYLYDDAPSGSGGASAMAGGAAAVTSAGAIRPGFPTGSESLAPGAPGVPTGSAGFDGSSEVDGIDDLDDAASGQGGALRSARTTERPWLEIDGERYPLVHNFTTIGRDPIVDIVLADQGISRRHSEIRVDVAGRHVSVAIRDLGSTNGTFVNSEQVRSQRLNDGDRITIGRTTAVLHLGSAAQ